jgi:DNA processing protein
VDSAAHRGALQGPAGTVAVLGTGIDIIYPKQNRTIAMKIVQEGGLMVSDFPLGTPPMAGNFPRRNRIISGLARACLVVEATVKSGSLITAELAAEQGREVFAVPGSINSPLHRGCHRLIKQGAKLAENVSDVLEELKLRAPKTPLPPPPKPGELLSFIDFEPTSVDDIAERSGMVAQVLLPELLILEMEGKILPAAGGTYQRV